jgi:hypothetical protein
LFRVFVSYCWGQQKRIFFVFLHIFGVVIHLIVKPFWKYLSPRTKLGNRENVLCARDLNFNLHDYVQTPLRLKI